MTLPAGFATIDHFERIQIFGIEDRRQRRAVHRALGGHGVLAHVAGIGHLLCQNDNVELFFHILNQIPKNSIFQIITGNRPAHAHRREKPRARAHRRSSPHPPAHPPDRLTTATMRTGKAPPNGFSRTNRPSDMGSRTGLLRTAPLRVRRPDVGTRDARPSPPNASGIPRASGILPAVLRSPRAPGPALAVSLSAFLRPRTDLFRTGPASFCGPGTGLSPNRYPLRLRTRTAAPSELPAQPGFLRTGLPHP